MIHPVKKVYITQGFGLNPQIYKRYGWSGHNGLDFRLFDERGKKASTALVFAPHDGVVKERRNDIKGYGNYLKIESDKEGSILGHLKGFKVNINKHVKQGDLIGVADNTGFSIGAHLHWTWYLHPRNRSNGYGGAIDPTPYLNMPKTYTEEEMTKVRLERDKHWDSYQDEIRRHKETKSELAGEKESTKSLKKQLSDSEYKNEQLIMQIAGKLSCEHTLEAILKELEKWVTKEHQWAQKEAELVGKYNELEAKKKSEIEALKEELEQLRKHADRLETRIKNLEENKPTTNKLWEWIKDFFTIKPN